MSTSSSPFVEAVKRPGTIIGGCALLLVVLLWFFVFFTPQGNKLSSLQKQEATLQQTVAQDDAKIAQLRNEASHSAQIQAMDGSLGSYAPATPDIYTYIQTLSGAGQSAGVTITSIAPGPAAAEPGTSYSAIPISTSVKGTYDQLLAYIRAVDVLPRLTQIKSLAINGGGTGSNRGSVLSATFQMSIFTSAKSTGAG